ncbi:MAG TPA: hypothetical protein VM577_00370, partial [Anaerovoracaceae bacterium]|nr:hypothetical protein [Anaerovoracaceae bacterium]
GGDLDLDSGSNVEKVRFSNLMLADNLNGNVASGGASMLTVPMIALKNAGNLECKNVTFIGRLNDGPVASRPKTLYAIGSITGASTGTTLTVDECFFDGFKVPVLFIPGQGDKDHLWISNCKIRSFGTEDAGATVLNSGISTTLCHMNIVNNHYIGAGTTTNTFLDIQPTSGTTTDIKVAVSGITGSPTDPTLANLIFNESGTSFNGVVSGNNWANEVDSAWYIVAGGTGNTGVMGDVFGSGAIDIILSMSTNNYQGTVIINPGTYTVLGHATANNFTNLSFIGNKVGKKYPLLNLSLSATATDSILNKFLVLGNRIESIQFNSIGSTHSIRPSFNATSNTAQTAAHEMVVKDCIFTNVSLNALDIGVGPFLDQIGQTAKLRIKIEGCTFSQTGAFSDSVSLLLPPAHIIHVKDCNFFGIGYAANIGSPTYAATNFNDENYIFENVTCDLTGFSINFSAPGSTTIDSYFVVSSSFAHITMKNCQITSTASLALSTTRVSAGLNASFLNFITILGKSVDIDECLFNGPTQTFVAGGITYVMPTVHIEPRQSCRVTNSRFVNGGLPLQIGGSTAFIDTLGDGCYIANNSFISTATTVTMTLLDFDIDIASNVLNGGHIGIHNNYFRHAAGSGTVQVRHTEQTDTYVAQGICQVYAPFFDVRFTGNKVAGNLLPPTVNPYTNFAGFVANTYNATSGTDGNTATSVHISNNRIDATNMFSGGVSTQGSTCAYVKAPLAFIQDNYLGMNNTLGSAITAFCGSLYLDMRATVSGAYTDTMVSGNMFSRRLSSGFASSLAHGWVYIPSTSDARGMIVDNSFSDITFDGTNAAYLNDNSLDANKWVCTRNKNQQVTMYVKTTVGRLTNSNNSTVTNTLLFNGYNQADLSVSLLNEDANSLQGQTMSISSNGTGEPSTNGVAIEWRVNLYDILPPFTHLVSVQQNVSWSANLPVVGTDQVALYVIRDGTVVNFVTDNMHANAGVSRTLGPIAPTQGINTRLDYSNGFVVAFRTSFQAPTVFTLTVFPMQITFKW